MRVISGIAKGTKLDTLTTLDTRPTLDRVKESLFNILQSKIYDSIVLDLFSGSGALGIEALSRGAKRAVFCDKSKYAYSIIKKNLTKTKLTEKAVVYNKTFEECLEALKEKFDIVFLDPPYDTDFGIKAISKIIKKEIIKDNAIIIIETDNEERILSEVVNLDVQVIDIRKYGKAKLVFLERKEQK